MRVKELPKLERINEMFEYNKDTGVFIRRIQVGPFRAGSVAGTKLNSGYIAIIVDGVPYQAHRLAWLVITGKSPDRWIDHINNDKSDNRFENLREVSWSGNLHNLKSFKKHNKAGFLGVSQRGGKWIAQIQKDGKKHHIGMFDTPELAHIAYLEKKATLRCV